MRIQVSAEHRTRIRLWRSSDPVVACRLELGLWLQRLSVGILFLHPWPGSRDQLRSG